MSDDTNFSPFSYPLAAQGDLIATPEQHQKYRPRGNWESDNAVDLGVPEGTPVYAIEDGVIGHQFGSLNSDNPLLQGLRLHLITSNDEYYYAHLSQFADGIRPDVHVKRGDLLGYSGVANDVPHLHLGVRNTDPLVILQRAYPGGTGMNPNRTDT